MKRIMIVILAVLLCSGCSAYYLKLLTSKCRPGGVKEGEIADDYVRVVCNNGSARTRQDQ